MQTQIHSPHFLRFCAGQWEPLEKGVIVETPVSLTVNGRVWITLMCTPADLEALALGFLYNEGVIKSKDEVVLMEICSQGSHIDVWLDHPVEQPKQRRRTSGCMDGATAVILEQVHPELRNDLVIAPHTIDHMIELLIGAQELYREVGGVHTSILSDGEHLIVSAEDVGRHNSLDKIAGRCLLDSIDFTGRILATTGRISSEMIQKAAHIGAPIVISRTSASSLSISIAEKWGITLIGYARCDQFIACSHPERILQQNEIMFEKNLTKGCLTHSLRTLLYDTQSS